MSERYIVCELDTLDVDDVAILWLPPLAHGILL